MTHSIKIAGIDQRDSAIKGCMDGGNAFGVVRGSIHPDMPMHPTLWEIRLDELLPIADFPRSYFFKPVQRS